MNKRQKKKIITYKRLDNSVRKYLKKNSPRYYAELFRSN